MFKKVLILNVLFLCTSIAGFCFSEEKLASIEQFKYGKNYQNESIADRLNRLETDFFGMTQSGDIGSRLDILANMANNSKQTAIIDPYDSYYGGKRKSKIKRFFDNVASTFDNTGYLTGFTPSITTTEYGVPNNSYNFMNNGNAYCPYHNSYHNNRYFNHPFNNHNFMHSNMNNNHFDSFGHNHHLPLHSYNPQQYGVNNYHPHNRINRTAYRLPPNVQTRSSVHIIRD